MEKSKQIELPNGDWKFITGYEGLYMVSTNGEVFSYYSKKTLKPIMSPAGYLRVHLARNGDIKTITIHRLVAETFIPNPRNKPTINHINEIKTDNRVENLEWMTTKEQNSYGTRLERARKNTDYKARKIDYSAIAKKHNYYEMSKKMKKPVYQLSLEGDTVARYDGIKEAERATGINAAGICECAKGKRKYSGGYIWKYAS